MSDRHEHADVYLYCIHILAWLASEDAAEASENISGGASAFPDLELLTEITTATDDYPTPTPAQIRAVAQDLLDLAEADDLDGPADFVVDGNEPIGPQVEAGIAKVLAGFTPAADPKLMALANRSLVAEVERLRRVLAVERGDESQAPEGWRLRASRNGRWWLREDGRARLLRLGVGAWEAQARDAAGTIASIGDDVYPSALEAMEALEVSDG